jgi:hypothetical protein
VLLLFRERASGGLPASSLARFRFVAANKSELRKLPGLGLPIGVRSWLFLESIFQFNKCGVCCLLNETVFAELGFWQGALFEKLLI